MGSASIITWTTHRFACVGIYEAEVMNGRMSKTIRKKARKEWQKKLREIHKDPFVDRVALAWWILFGKQYQRR